MNDILQKIGDIIESERSHVYEELLGDKTKNEFVGIGEFAEHITLDNDQQCKGALKALDYTLRILKEVK